MMYVGRAIVFAAMARQLVPAQHHSQNAVGLFPNGKETNSAVQRNKVECLRSALVFGRTAVLLFNSVRLFPNQI
jgi:hypothetical protein